MNSYLYKAKTLRVIDGDTIEVFIDLGFGIWHKHKVRLLDFDAPETYRPSCKAEKETGEKVKAFLKNKIENREIILQTYKRTKGKYGRILAKIFIDEVDIIQEMVDLGMEKKDEWK